MSWLGNGTPATLMGYLSGSNPMLPGYLSQPSEGLQVNRERIRSEEDQAGKNRDFTAAQSAAGRAQEASLLAAKLGFEGTQAAAGRAQERSLLDANLGFQGTQAGLQREFQGKEEDLTRQFQGEQNAAGRASQEKVAAMPWDYKRQVFGTISPLLQGLLGGGGGGIGGGSVRAGGPVEAAPGPTTGASVWDAGQIQGQINDQKATSAQAAATQERGNAARVAGAGFGANSPLLMALNNQTQAARMAGDSSAELATSLGASQANANLGVEQAKVNAQNYATRQEALTRQKQASLNYQGSLVAALAGMI